MKDRPVTDAETRLFRKTVARAGPRIPVKPKTKKHALAVKTGPSGLDGNTREKLKRGAKPPDTRIDLHGHTEQGAHRALLTFLQRAQKNGHKLVLVITGKGNPPPSEGAPWTMREFGVLKEMVPRWLNEPDFAALIAGTSDAHRRHGGGGAIYIYLRKER